MTARPTPAALLAAAIHEHNQTLTGCRHGLGLSNECEYLTGLILATPSGQALLAQVDEEAIDEVVARLTADLAIVAAERDALLDMAAAPSVAAREVRGVTWATVATPEMATCVGVGSEAALVLIHCMDIEFDGTKARSRYDFQEGEMRPPKWSEWSPWAETWPVALQTPDAGEPVPEEQLRQAGPDVTPQGGSDADGSAEL